MLLTLADYHLGSPHTSHSVTSYEFINVQCSHAQSISFFIPSESSFSAFSGGLPSSISMLVSSTMVAATGWSFISCTSSSLAAHSSVAVPRSCRSITGAGPSAPPTSPVPMKPLSWVLRPRDWRCWDRPGWSTNKAAMAASEVSCASPAYISSWSEAVTPHSASVAVSHVSGWPLRWISWSSGCTLHFSSICIFTECSVVEELTISVVVPCLLAPPPLPDVRRPADSRIETLLGASVPLALLPADAGGAGCMCTRSSTSS
mmetsp:Transcript_19944/g.38043  ORF Transcript_19944/g.38043 Transcript_19944/m.38043 type:complete len:260 (+) Transcript_19944:273-1052(+)